MYTKDSFNIKLSHTIGYLEMIRLLLNGVDDCRLINTQYISVFCNKSSTPQERGQKGEKSVNLGVDLSLYEGVFQLSKFNFNSANRDDFSRVNALLKVTR